MTTYTEKSPRAGVAHMFTAAPWFNRLVMVPPAVIMLSVSARFIFDPTHAASSTGVALGTPEALTDTRVVGGLTLAIVFVIASCLFSRRNLRLGHATIAVLMAVILAVRMFGFAIDGTTLGHGRSEIQAHR